MLVSASLGMEKFLSLVNFFTVAELLQKTLCEDYSAMNFYFHKLQSNVTVFSSFNRFKILPEFRIFLVIFFHLISNSLHKLIVFLYINIYFKRESNMEIVSGFL